MTRLANTQKAGYYPTPVELTHAISTYITAPYGGRILDPCAGTGEALFSLSVELNTKPYGSELDTIRAAELRQKLPVGQALHTDYRQLKADPNSFNLLFLNPPYMWAEKEADGKAQRAETQWLIKTRPYLQPNGLLVFVVPAHILTRKDTLEYLSSWYTDFWLLRFPDGEFERFKQVVLFGRRHDRHQHPRLAQINSLRKLAQQPQDLPVLSIQDKAHYTLPKLTRKAITFTSLFINPNDALAEAAAVGIAASDAFTDHLYPTSAEQPLNPLMPLKIGHMNAIIAAGHLNNQLLTDEETGEQFLIKGRTYKEVIEATTETKLENGHTQRQTTRTDHAITDITTLTADGEITAVSGPSLQPFLERWLPQLTDIVANSYPPRYQFDLNGYAPILDRLNQGRIIPNTTMRGLLPAQRHAAAAIATQLKTASNAILVGEMGTGKTVTGTAIAALVKANHTIVLCPPHLVEKWIREIEVTWPSATAVALATISDVDRFFAHSGPIVGVMKETSARSATGWHHAFNFHGPAAMPSRTSKKPWQLTHHGRRAPTNGRSLQQNHQDPNKAKWFARRPIRCPHCGQPIRNSDNDIILSPVHFQNAQLKCQKCKSPLHQDTRRYAKNEQPNGSLARLFAQERRLQNIHAMEEGPLKRGLLKHLSNPKNNGYARYPLASYINRHYKRRLDLLLADEAHQFKGSDSDRGYAFHRLVVAAKKTVALTGTIYGGKASNLFNLLYRLVPEMAHDWKHNDTAKWVQQYGIMQEVSTVTTDQDGKLSGNRKDKTAVKELPGGTPDMLPWLLNRSVFMSLADMGFALPNYEEIPISVTMTPAQEAMYKSLDDQLMDKMRDRLIRGDRSLLGAYLQSLLSWPDSPWRPKVVRDPKLRDEREQLEAAGVNVPDSFDLIARVNGLPNDRTYPKEEQIIELIQEELRNGRKCLLLCQQTGTLDITPQWTHMLADYNIKAAVLNTDPSRREKWVDKQLAEGVEVIITHPKKIETGMDLLEFPTIIWMGTEYSAYTVLQASRRSWRIGQKNHVKVFFFAYANTLQEQALHLIASKVGAIQRINGDTIDHDTLADLDTANDLLTELGRIATGQREKLTAVSLQDAFSAANTAIQHAQTTIGDYSATEPIEAPNLADEVANELINPPIKTRSVLPIPIPGTNLSFSNLRSWYVAFGALLNRRPTAENDKQREAAIKALTIEMCYESDEGTAEKAIKLLKRNRPPRGRRHNHPSTPLIVALRNRLAHGIPNKTAVSHPPPPPTPAPNGANRLIFGIHNATGQRRKPKQQPTVGTQMSLFTLLT